MNRRGWIFLLLFVPYCDGTVDESEQSKRVKKLCQEIGAATIKGDGAKVIDLTYASLVKQLGGRENAIKATEKSLKEINDKGYTFDSFDVGEPGKFLIEGKNTFVVVPTNVQMSFAGGKILAKSYLLGISGDEGKTWKFADGAGISNKEDRKRLLPTVPPKLQFPQPEQPKIIKD